jgi:hypothetical protein
MITKASLAVYERYAGDIDGWARVGDAKEKNAISDEIWSDIDWLRVEISALQKGQVSADYGKEIQQKIITKTENTETAQELLQTLERIQKRRGA